MNTVSVDRDQGVRGRWDNVDLDRVLPGKWRVFVDRALGEVVHVLAFENIGQLPRFDLLEVEKVVHEANETVTVARSDIQEGVVPF